MTVIRPDDPRLAGPVTVLTRYFQGERVRLDLPLDLDETSPFTLLVWDLTRTIPFGETRSYGWIAAELGMPRAARAVGSALRRNPVPILIPCHRVVARDGSLRGFADGIDLKAQLLGLEGWQPPA